MTQDNFLGKELFIGEQDSNIKVKRVGFSQDADNSREDNFSFDTLNKNYHRLTGLVLGFVRGKRGETGFFENGDLMVYKDPKNNCEIRVNKNSDMFPDCDVTIFTLPGKNDGETEEIIVATPKVISEHGDATHYQNEPTHILRRFSSTGPIGQGATVQEELSTVYPEGIVTNFYTKGEKSTTDPEKTALSPKWIATKICRAFSLNEKEMLPIFEC